MSEEIYKDQTSADNYFEVNSLTKKYETRSDSILSSIFGEDKYLKAVDEVSFNVKRGEILGLAGQSGCGKSTLGELLVGLQQPTSGEIIWKGKDITDFNQHQMKDFRRDCQVIFQDPYEAMNPRFSVYRTVSEPLVIHDIGGREERLERVKNALRDAGLSPPESYLELLPQELSGGERQRVCIARALVLNPDFLVADEPVSMLDVSIRAGILQVFKRLQENRDVTILYISHDLSTINYLCDRTMIMYLGNNVELGPTEDVIHEPAHPYTEALIESVPDPDPRNNRTGSTVRGEVPDPINLSKGCRFSPDCKYQTEECLQSEPQLEGLDDEDSHKAACYHPVNK